MEGSEGSGGGGDGGGGGDIYSDGGSDVNDVVVGR